MEIENISKSNISAIRDLHIQVYADEPWNEHWEPDWVEDRYTCILKSQYAFGYAATENGEVIGAILGRGVPFKGDLELEINEFFIAQSKQRLGIGKLLLKHLESELKAEGFKFVVLLTIHGSVAEKFYIDQGFKKDDRMRFWYKELR